MVSNYGADGAANLDDRMLIYTRAQTNTSKPCSMPYGKLWIYHTGDIGLCCYDWNRTVTFGNIKTNSLLDILKTDKMKQVGLNLQAGNRVEDVCSRCWYSRQDYTYDI